MRSWTDCLVKLNKKLIKNKHEKQNRDLLIRSRTIVWLAWHRTTKWSNHIKKRRYSDSVFEIQKRKEKETIDLPGLISRKFIYWENSLPSNIFGRHERFERWSHLKRRVKHINNKQRNKAMIKNSEKEYEEESDRFCPSYSFGLKNHVLIISIKYCFLFLFNTKIKIIFSLKLSE